MAGSTISGTITSTVTLGSANYPSPLTITGTGDIAITSYGGAGVYGPAGSGTLINDGAIAGGKGIEGGGIGGAGVSLRNGSTATNVGTIAGGGGGNGAGKGGAGIYLAAGAALTNQGMIGGGYGGSGTGGIHNVVGVGGAGALLNGGTLTNDNTIAGGYSEGGNRYAGSGVVLLAGTLINTGMIVGGYSPDGNGIGDGGVRYGEGVYLAASASLLNAGGTIVGGSNPGPAGGEAGDGVFMAAGASLVLAGVVIGGVAEVNSGAGVYLSDGGSLDNTGTVIGGANGGTGIDLAHGGTLTNAGTIIGGSSATSPGVGFGFGVVLSAGGLLINTAFITGGQGLVASGAGLDMANGGTATNSAGATITGGAGSSIGGSSGAGADVDGGTLTNAGTVLGGIDSSGGAGYDGIGVSLTDAAVVTNTGSIGGGSGGYNYGGGRGGVGASIGGSTLASTLVNSGIITGGNGSDGAPGATAELGSFALAGGAGVYIGSHTTIKHNGTVVPWATDTLINNGTIVGGVGVSVAAGGAFISNGTIFGGDGVTLASSGTVLGTGTIIGGVGAYVAAGGTFTNGGTVVGGMYGGVTADAVMFAAGGTLVIEPSAAFVGQVVGSASATDVMYLGFTSRAGTLGGIGTQIVNFSQITVAADASWTLTGTNTIASGGTLTELSGATLNATGTLVNDGAIVLDPSSFASGGLIGTCLVTIEAGSTFGVQGTIATTETVMFDGGGGALLHLYSPYEMAAGVTNFGVGDTIDLKGIDFSSVHYASGQLTFGTGGDIALALAGDEKVHAVASADGADVFATLCFCTNTQILTPSGERAVQDLAVGDLVTTHRGEARPIVWLGVGKVLATRGQRSAATPVIVRKGALAENVPNRDLRVTKGHAFWFGGVLIPVEFLVNHRLIEWDDRAQEVELYHIELATHDVLVANGAPAESFRDDGNRWLFQNARSGCDLPPQSPCAPVLTGGPVVDAVWQRLMERTGARPGFALTDDPDLHLLVDGARVDARHRHGTAYIFALAACPHTVRIVSRAAAPAELGVARDPRVLGVAVRQIALRQGTRFHIVEAADGALADGFHPFEPADGLRWTDGDAALPAALFEGYDGPMELVLHIGGTTRYPLLGVAERYAKAA